MTRVLVVLALIALLFAFVTVMTLLAYIGRGVELQKAVAESARLAAANARMASDARTRDALLRECGQRLITAGTTILNARARERQLQAELEGARRLAERPGSNHATH
jgi:hypothetical protein